MDSEQECERLKEEFNRAEANCQKSGNRVRDLLHQKDRLTEELCKMTEDKDREHTEYLELKSLQYNYKE